MVHSALWKQLGVTLACVLLLLVSLLLTMQPKIAFAQQEMISISPTQGPPGTKVTVTGTGWNEHASREIDVPIQISAPGSQPTQVADPLPDPNGNFIVTFIVPTNMPTGQLTVSAIIGNGGSADAWFTVTANTPTVIVQKVFTADNNNNAETSFAPGDPIHYMVEAQNTSSTAVTATVTYRATGPQQIYSWSGSASLASGPLRFYSAPTIPTTASAGTYTITVTITYNGLTSSGQSQFTVVPLHKTVNTTTYAGYAASGTQTNPTVYKDVTATWKVPTVVSCSKTEISSAATWDGFTDSTSNNATDLVQAGTESYCSKGQPVYFAVWQVYQGGKTQGAQRIYSLLIFPGNQVKVEVKSYGFGEFGIDIWNLTLGSLHWQKVVSGDNASKASAVAECIQEDPENIPLAHFSSVTITCTANNHPIGTAGSIIETLVMSQAKTGNLNASGSGDTFTVDWVHS